MLIIFRVVGKDRRENATQPDAIPTSEWSV
jgi:hypothetical protein